MKKVYKPYNLIVIGDSTARRAALGLYGVLNSTTSTTDNSVPSVSLVEVDSWQVIDTNKNEITEPCQAQEGNDFNPTICRSMMMPQKLSTCSLSHA